MTALGSTNCTNTGLLIDRTHMQNTEDLPCTYRKAARNITARREFAGGATRRFRQMPNVRLS
jgi:hypothetical protein